LCGLSVPRYSGTLYNLRNNETGERIILHNKLLSADFKVIILADPSPGHNTKIKAREKGQGA
jgi:hypothetical protein